jgi:hypothetical protein
MVHRSDSRRRGYLMATVVTGVAAITLATVSLVSPVADAAILDPTASYQLVARHSGKALTGHGSVHGPGHQAVIADSDGEVLLYHYYANNGASFLGINRIGYDSAGWPFAY